MSSMKRVNRRCLSGILNHCYQRTKRGEVLFYTVSDYLVFFMQFCVAARKRDVRVLALCLMPDHIHHSTVPMRKKDLSSFVQDYSSQFVCEFNRICRREGSLFQRPFGSAPKVGAKKGRTNLIYVWNNPVERQLCEKAEAYRWNFLAYAGSTHPFSEKLVLSHSSKAMRRAVAEVKAQFHAGHALTYHRLQCLFHVLDKKEKAQLVDFIISTYNVIDYDEAFRYFDGASDALAAAHASTGSEHDLNEVFVGKSDAVYTRLTRVIMREVRPDDIHGILSGSPEERFRLLKLLRSKTDVPTEQIAKYLHLVLCGG